MDIIRVCSGGFMPFRDWLVKYGKQTNILVKAPATTSSTSRVGVSVRTGTPWAIRGSVDLLLIYSFQAEKLL